MARERKKSSTYTSHAYVRSIAELTKGVERLQAQCSDAQQGIEHGRLREEVLSLMLAHQALALRMLAALQHAGVAPQQPGGSQRGESAPRLPKLPPGTQPIVLGDACPELRDSPSRAVRVLLAKATWSLVRELLACDTAGWGAYLRGLFAELTLLLELVQRHADGPAPPAPPPQPLPAPPASAREQPQESLGAHPALDEQRLAARIDHMLCRLVVGCLVNPQPLFQLSTINQATGQHGEAPSPAHWLRVKQRLQLTDDQAARFSIGMGEFERQRAAASAERAALSEDALAAGELLVARGAAAHGCSCSPGGSGSGDSERPGSGSSVSGGPARAPASACYSWGSGVGPPPASHGSPAPAGLPAELLAAGTSQQQQQQQQGGAGPGLGTGAGAAHPYPATAAGPSCVSLERQLGRLLHGMSLPTLLMFLLGADTLTARQHATMIVSSYPWAPTPGAIEAAAVEERREHAAAQASAAAGPAAAGSAQAQARPRQRQRQQQHQQALAVSGSSAPACTSLPSANCGAG